MGPSRQPDPDPFDRLFNGRAVEVDDPVPSDEELTPPPPPPTVDAQAAWADWKAPHTNVFPSCSFPLPGNSSAQDPDIDVSRPDNLLDMITIRDRHHKVALSVSGSLTRENKKPRISSYMSKKI